MDAISTREFYEHYYPYESLVAWLTRHGHALERFEFALEGKSASDDKLYKRYVVARTANELRAHVVGFTGIRAFHFGGIYPEKCDRRSAPTQRIFSIDIDLTDYDFLDLTDADGAVSPAQCDRAYPIAAFAIFVLRHLLGSAFGFQEVLVCYSGRRGVHLHVTDPTALAMSNEARVAVTAYLTATFTKSGGRISSYTRGVAKMYELVQPAMDAFERTLVGEMDLFGNGDQIVMFVERLELQWHDALAALAEHALAEDDGPGAWAVIKRRVLDAGVGWFKERLLDTVLAYLWPRMDENVSKSLNHLTKVPFCAHASSRRVAVALDPATCVTKWSPARAPRLDAWEPPAMAAAIQNLVAATQKPSVVDVEDAVAPAPRPLPRKIGFKRKQSPLVPN